MAQWSVGSKIQDTILSEPARLFPQLEKLLSRTLPSDVASWNFSIGTRLAFSATGKVVSRKLPSDVPSVKVNTEIAEASYDVERCHSVSMTLPYLCKQ